MGVVTSPAISSGSAAGQSPTADAASASVLNPSPNEAVQEEHRDPSPVSRHRMRSITSDVRKTSHVSPPISRRDRPEMLTQLKFGEPDKAHAVHH